MSMFRQFASVTAMNLRSVPQRLGTSRRRGRHRRRRRRHHVGLRVDTQHVAAPSARAAPTARSCLRAGATDEFSSTLLVDAVATIKDAPGIARAAGDAGRVRGVRDGMNLLRKENGARAGLSVRGVEAAAWTVRPEISIVEGRAFKPGLREIIVGRGALAEFRGVAIGDEVALRDSRWTIVGVFESDGDANESRLMADAATLLSAYQRTAVNSVTVRLESEAAFENSRPP